MHVHVGRKLCHYTSVMCTEILKEVFLRWATMLRIEYNKAHFSKVNSLEIEDGLAITEKGCMYVRGLENTI